MSRTPKTPPVPPEHKRWTGAELAARPGEWTRTLTSAEIDEFSQLADATADLIAEPIPVRPALLALANDVSHSLLNGFGFVVLRGINPADYDPAALAAAYYRFGRLIGGPRSQNAAGHLLGHVRDIGADLTDPTIRIYQTNQRQTFHTDSTDVVGLLCLKTAASGGESLLASATTIYASCVAHDPNWRPPCSAP
ncbi:MAG: TauD/TfdA family dioxygenase [Acidimicrobiales bacterium]